MTNRLFAKLFIAFTLLCSSFAGVLNAQTYEGVHFTKEEVAVWQQRANKATSVNYASNGDVVAYSPGDWDRIKAYADEFLANPAQETWIGSALVGGNAPYYNGVRLECAAFAYLMYRDSDPTLAMKYANNVRNILIGQVAIPLANIAAWTGSLVQEQGFNEARWVQRLLFSYDYIKNSGALSAADKTLLNTWFLNQGNWFANNIQTGAIGECFPQRLNDNYTTRGRDAKPNGESYGKYAPGQYPDGFDYTYVDAAGAKKNKIAYLAKHWNNRRSDKASAAAMIGMFLNNANLIKHGRQYAKEWLKYSVYPDGTMGEYERNGDYSIPQQGMSYGAVNIQMYILLADALARKGDLSLYQYSTTEGLHGTEVLAGGQPKTLKTVLDKYCDNMQATPAIYHLSVASGNRIDSYSESNNVEYTWDVLLTIANKYYKSNFYQSIYTRTAPQVDNFPAPEDGISSASAVWFPWGGTGAEFPGLSLMYGQMEDIVTPYSAAALCNTPDGLTVPYVGARHTRMIWNHSLGALAYNVRYRIGTGAWTQVDNVKFTFLDLNTLTPGSQYEWAVQTVTNTCTSNWATSIFVTTPDGCTGTGYLTRTYWKGLQGKGLNDLPFTSRTPTSKTNVTIFEAPGNVADDYGQVLDGFVCAPKTGNYTFWVAGDDEVDLWVSSDDDPAKATRACFTSGYTASRQWTKHSSQKSVSYYMVAGYRYYVRMRHKEVVGNDYAAVGWTHPDGVTEQPIPSSRLSPYAPNAAPTVSLTSPASGANLPEGDVTLTANAADADGTILRVEFYQGSTKIGESTKAPYSYTYSNVPTGTYTFKAVAFDNRALGTTTSVTTVTVNTSASNPGGATCSATGYIHREVWDNVTGAKVANIPVTTTPTSEDDLTIFETETNRGSNYGQRLRGYVCPPTTGAYVFWIAGDDDAELWLSTDANPSNKRMICRTGWWTGSRDWTKYTHQQSVAITLTAGTKYYIEALHKEAASNDNFAVGWQLPGGALERPIPGSRLAPFTTTPPPPSTLCSQTGSVTHDYWSNVTGTKTNTIPTTAPNTSTNISTGIDFATNRGDNYAERFKGYICAPTTGSYTFYVSGDDQIDFYLSPDKNPAGKVRRAYVNWSTPVRTYTTEGTQKSAAITLAAGTAYYFEVLHKEGSYGDHVSLAWTTPGSSTITIVPASSLVPFTATGARMGLEEEVAEVTPDAPSFTVFPNPASNQVTIRASRTLGTIWHVELVSQVAQKVLAIEDIDASATAEASLDLTRYNLIPGLYLVRLRDGEGRTTTHKFIKSE